MAKKTQGPNGGDTLGDIAASLGSLLGNAEKQWRAWQGPRDAVVQAVTEVRDRAVALLSEMDVAGLGAKKGKKDKKGKKADKAGKAARKAEKAGKKAEKADRKAGKAGKKKGKKAGTGPAGMAGDLDL